MRQIRIRSSPAHLFARKLESEKQLQELHATRCTRILLLRGMHRAAPDTLCWWQQNVPDAVECRSAGPNRQDQLLLRGHEHGDIFDFTYHGKIVSPMESDLFP